MINRTAMDGLVTRRRLVTFVAIGLVSILCIILVQIVARLTNEPWLLLYLILLTAILLPVQYFLTGRFYGQMNETIVELVGRSGALLIGPQELESGRIAEYGVYFYYVFQENEGKELARLVADYLEAANLKIDYVVGHHLHRQEPKEYHNEYGLVQAVAGILDKPFATYHEFQDRGRPGYLEVDRGGKSLSGRVLILDDVTTQGTTLLQVARVLRKLGEDVVIRDAFVFLVRPTGKKYEDLIGKLRKSGIRLHYFITSKELLEGLHSRGIITDDQLEQAMKDEDFQPVLDAH